MESRETKSSQENIASKIWNHFAPKEAKLREIIAYGMLDGVFLGAGLLSAYYFINQSPKMAIMFVMGVPFLLVTRIAIRRPTNLNGEPRQ